MLTNQRTTEPTYTCSLENTKAYRTLPCLLPNRKTPAVL